MIKTIITPITQNISFNVPLQYVGKELEVIAFEKNEGILVNDEKKEMKRFASFSKIKIDTNNFRFDRDEANAR